MTQQTNGSRTSFRAAIAERNALRKAVEASDRARRACQVLVEEIGSDGPANIDDVAMRAAAEIRSLRDLLSHLRAAQEESEHQMHLRVRASYDKTIADTWRLALSKVEAQRDAYQEAAEAAGADYARELAAHGLTIKQKNERIIALEARVASMQESMMMACEEPPTGCQCAGCSYARERGGAQ